MQIIVIIRFFWIFKKNVVLVIDESEETKYDKNF